MKIAPRCIACDGDALDRTSAVLMPFVAYRVFGWEPMTVTPDMGFRDIPPGQAHSVCNSLLCRACGMIFLDMRFDDDELRALYTDYRGVAYTQARARFEPGYEARNAILLGGNGYMPMIEAFIAPHVPKRPRVLDWGGDTGINTPFRGSAKLHHIYDISERPVLEGARSVGLAELRAETYDLIVFSNVLEHVPSPMGCLREIVAEMKDDTVLYVELPHEDVVRLIEPWPQRLAAKRHWHEHINFFSLEALDALFARLGLAVLQRVTHAISAGGKESHVFSIVAKRAL